MIGGMVVWVVLAVMAAVVLWVVVAGIYEGTGERGKALAERAKFRAEVAEQQQALIVCPHCNTAGHVTTEAVKLKKGISGGKATGAVLTGGLSVLATGLSRKEGATAARCGNCGSRWTF